MLSEQRVERREVELQRIPVKRAIRGESPREAPVALRLRAGAGSAGTVGRVFVFFSNRLGCMGSILVSLVGTLFVLLVLGVINLN